MLTAWCAPTILLQVALFEALLAKIGMKAMGDVDSNQDHGGGSATATDDDRDDRDEEAEDVLLARALGGGASAALAGSGGASAAVLSDITRLPGPGLEPFVRLPVASGLVLPPRALPQRAPKPGPKAPPLPRTVAYHLDETTSKAAKKSLPRSAAGTSGRRSGP